jgi:uncharacterized protein YjbI with pentapeptide repeats
VGLQGASLAGARLVGASLEGAQLQGTTFEHAQLMGASFDGAKIEAVNFSGSFLWRTSGTNIKPEAIKLEEVKWGTNDLFSSRGPFLACPNQALHPTTM